MLKTLLYSVVLYAEKWKHCLRVCNVILFIYFLFIWSRRWYTAFEMWWHTRRNQILSFERNGRVHLNRPGGVSSVDYWHSRGVRISDSNAGYTMFRGSVKSTGYLIHSPVSPSIPLPSSPCAITFQLDSTPSFITVWFCWNCIKMCYKICKYLLIQI